jgi:hypothetical protein
MAYFLENSTPTGRAQSAGWVLSRLSKKSIRGAAAVYNEEGRLVHFDDSFFTGKPRGIRLPGETSRGGFDAHIETRVMARFGALGLLKRGYTVVIALNRPWRPCWNVCDNAVRTKAAETQTRFLVRGTTGPDGPVETPYGRQYSNAALENGGLNPDELYPGTQVEPEGGSRTGSGGRGGSVPEGGGGATRALGGAAGALGIAGDVLMIIDIIVNGPQHVACGMAPSFPGCQPIPYA